MRRRPGGFRLLANAAFVSAVLGLAGFGLSQVARRQWRVQRTFFVRAEFSTIAGVTAGTRVRVQGIDAGLVETVVPPDTPGKDVLLVFRVDERLRGLVRSDAVARIASEGTRPGAPLESPVGWCRETKV